MSLQEDISPEDKQMLRWIEEATQQNNFRLRDLHGSFSAALLYLRQ